MQGPIKIQKKKTLLYFLVARSVPKDLYELRSFAYFFGENFEGPYKRTQSAAHRRLLCGASVHEGEKESLAYLGSCTGAAMLWFEMREKWSRG